LGKRSSNDKKRERVYVSPFGTEVVSKREQMDLTQSELARMAGIDRKTLRRIENSELVLPQSVYRVSMIFGVDYMRLGEIGDSNPAISRDATEVA
jgi:transcriptional regulator with XRE-family HTH domain